MTLPCLTSLYKRSPCNSSDRNCRGYLFISQCNGVDKISIFGKSACTWIRFTYCVNRNKIPCRMLCHPIGTTVPTAWHNCANMVAQVCQRYGTSVTSLGEVSYQLHLFDYFCQFSLKTFSMKTTGNDSTVAINQNSVRNAVHCIKLCAFTLPEL